MGHVTSKTRNSIMRVRVARILAAVLLMGAVGSAASPAFAKKQKSSETNKVQKTAKAQNATKCMRGPVPPFMRNPRFMNRGFVKNRCKKQR